MTPDLSPEAIANPGKGPIFVQLSRRIAGQIDSGRLKPGESLPAERDLAVMTGLSRVTVRKAVRALVNSGQLVRRRGSGTFVAPKVARFEMALSRLSSLSEDMARRGKMVASVWLSRGLFVPSPDEVTALGLMSHGRVARLERVRRTDGLPLAVERAALPASILPDPKGVGPSLYAHLSARGLQPVRAVQRISAADLDASDAELLEVPAGVAGLKIERISSPASGKVVEFTRSIYRGDAYDFTAELQLSAPEKGERE